MKKNRPSIKMLLLFSVPFFVVCTQREHPINIDIYTVYIYTYIYIIFFYTRIFIYLQTTKKGTENRKSIVRRVRFFTQKEYFYYAVLYTFYSFIPLID